MNEASVYEYASEGREEMSVGREGVKGYDGEKGKESRGRVEGISGGENERKGGKGGAGL